MCGDEIHISSAAVIFFAFSLSADAATAETLFFAYTSCNASHLMHRWMYDGIDDAEKLHNKLIAGRMSEK